MVQAQESTIDKAMIYELYISLCGDFLISGMNLNSRRLLSHIEYEPHTYCEAFYVELEAASSPLWSFVNACSVLVCLCHVTH